MLTKIHPSLKKSNSLGSVSFDSKYGSPAKLSMRLLIKAVGDVDYFSLPSKNVFFYKKKAKIQILNFFKHFLYF